MDQTAPAALEQPAFPVVGIGASAGGLEAVSELLAELPAKTGMAFILVQHLDPGHASMLVEILAKKTEMIVAEARDGMSVEADHLYVIPPNATLTLAGNALRITGRDGTPRTPAPIDALFRSLAAERGRGAIGVVLSGTGSDGTRGAQEIKEASGIVLAQDPDAAAFDAMPRNAINAGAVDLVLRAGDLARHLAGLAGHLGSHTAEATAESIEAAAETGEGENWKRILRLLRGSSGIDFTHYKRSTLGRRVARRQALQHIPELSRYVDLLDQDPAELAALSRDALIGVTGFFRDPDSFEALERTVLPALLEGRAQRDPLRIWVPGCSSGEEVYSISICVLEHLGPRAGRVPIQIFGTDAAESAIASARAATYPDGIETEVSRARLDRWFVKVDDHYQIAKQIRDLCVFSRHDVTRDPPFSRIDLVSCRNLLIYLDAALQRQVLGQFHYAVKPRGFLVLGPSEAIGASADLFAAADPRHRVFTRKDIRGHAHIHAALDQAPPAAFGAERPTRPAPLENDRLQRETDRALLARHGPAAIVIDEDFNVLQFRGHTAAFLEHSAGAASLNLQQLASPALLVALTPVLREARASKVAAKREGVRVELHGSTRTLQLEVSPLRVPEGAAPCYLVIIEESTAPRSRFWERLFEAVARRVPPPGGAAAELEQLRAELAASREFIKSTAEEHEAAKEELKSLHEEALSASEEFQSTNEELETAKEELQSSNEELATTNDELRTRNRELQDLNETLRHARDFADAIIETTRHPLLVLDRRLRVLRANGAFYRLFQVAPSDTEKRYLYDLGDRQWDIPQLRTLLEDTLTETHAVEDYQVRHAFPRLGLRTMVLNARRLGSDRQAEMILLGIEDATVRLDKFATLAETDRRKDEFLAMLGHELRNPLAPIRNCIEVLRQLDSVDPQTRRCIDVLGRQSTHMIRLVDDLLEMSRITRGNLHIDREELTVDDVLERAIEATQPFLEARGHRLSVAHAPQPLHVLGDMVRLTQIFTNLLNNAAKYTPQGGAIDISCAAEDGHALIKVSDNGQGLPAELVPHLFEAFGQRAGRSRTGLGIGLPLSQRLAELHGGSIAAQSAGPGKGSVFTVRLPLIAPPSRNSAPRAASSPASRATPELQGCRVLVVDDNADGAHTLEVFLDMTGCEVRCAYDGAGALALAAEFRPEVIVLDLDLPDIDGYEVLRRLRTAVGVQPGVIALSGFAQPADVARMREAGFDAILRKPASAASLVSTIASLRQPRAT